MAVSLVGRDVVVAFWKDKFQTRRAFGLAKASVQAHIACMLPLIQLPGLNHASLPLGLGTLQMGTKITASASRELLDTFLAAGGRVIDTAAIYSDWIPGERRRVERLLGRWLASRGCRQAVFLVTKGCHPEGAFDRETAGARVRPDIVAEEIEGSLATLGTDYIDLWFLHRDDPAFPVQPLVDALNEQVRSGRIRAFGASNWTTDRLGKANAYAASSGQDGFWANQMMWSLGTRAMAGIRDQSLVRMDDAMETMHGETGLLAMPYSSLAGGYFSKVAAGGVDARTERYDTPGNRDRLAWVRAVMAGHETDATTACLHFLWNHPFPVLPLVGPSNRLQLEACLAACRRELITEPCP